MSTPAQKILIRRPRGSNLWLEKQGGGEPPAPPSNTFRYTVLPSESEVGMAMFEELVRYSKEKAGDMVVVLLGGRGAQAMYRIIAERAKTDEIDGLLSRLHVFTQDALAPMRMGNGLSFVRDFERLLEDQVERLADREVLRDLVYALLTVRDNTDSETRILRLWQARGHQAH